MRDLLNLLDNVLLESVGLANRKPGTLFANPQGDELVFQGVTFYPQGGGAYATPEEWQQALDQVCQQMGISPTLIQWVDDKGNVVAVPANKKGGFGIAQFTGSTGQQYTLARHFRAISPIPIENAISNKLPGGYRLQTDVAKKEAAGFKPTDVLGSNLTNLSPADILQGIQQHFGVNSDEANATEIFMKTSTYPIQIPLGNMNFTAFTNYFCEMLQPMALVLGHKTVGQAKQAEKDWLSQGGYTSCRITFGSSKIGGLTDSSLANPAGQVIGVSTKAEDGAKASAKNLLDKVNEMQSDPDGQKLLKKYAKEIKLIKTVTAGSTPGVLDTAVLAKIITADERDQILAIRKLPPGSSVIGKKLLSARLEEKYAGRKGKNPEAVIPFFHIRAVLANEVADWVNKNTNFGKAAAAILNWGAFIQIKTHAKQLGSKIIIEPFEVIYPSEAVTNVELSAGKTFYSTGSKGNFTFVILFNGATKIEDDSDNGDIEPDVTSPAKLSADDLNQIGREPRLSGPGAKASRQSQDADFDEKTLGRKKKG